MLRMLGSELQTATDAHVAGHTDCPALRQLQTAAEVPPGMMLGAGFALPSDSCNRGAADAHDAGWPALALCPALPLLWPALPRTLT